MARQYRGRFSFFYNYPNNDGLNFVFTENADISNTYNWYYVCSRDLKTTFYPFWNRVYDIVKGNLS